MFLWLKAGIAGAAALAVGVLALMVRRSGAEANEAGHVKADAAARARVDKAVAGAPRDHDELVGELRKGGRL